MLLWTVTRIKSFQTVMDNKCQQCRLEPGMWNCDKRCDQCTAMCKCTKKKIKNLEELKSEFPPFLLSVQQLVQRAGPDNELPTLTPHGWSRHGKRGYDENASKWIKPMKKKDVRRLIDAADFELKPNPRGTTNYCDATVTFPFTVGSQGK